jgi:hypothetical protein
MPIHAGGCVSRAERGAGCTTGVGAGTSTSVGAGTSAAARAGGRGATAAGAGASSPPSFVALLPTRSSSETAI